MNRVKRQEILLIDEGEYDEDSVLRMLHRNQLGEQLRYANPCEIQPEQLTEKYYSLHPPALIIFDLSLPKIDLIELLQKIKKQEKLAAVPVIALTGTVNDPNLAAYYRIGISAHLLKPAGFGDFARTLIRLGLFDLLLAGTTEHSAVSPGQRSAR